MNPRSAATPPPLVIEEAEKPSVVYLKCGLNIIRCSLTALLMLKLSTEKYGTLSCYLRDLKIFLLIQILRKQFDEVIPIWAFSLSLVEKEIFCLYCIRALGFADNLKSGGNCFYLARLTSEDYWMISKQTRIAFIFKRPYVAEPPLTVMAA